MTMVVYSVLLKKDTVQNDFKRYSIKVLGMVLLSFSQFIFFNSEQSQHIIKKGMPNKHSPKLTNIPFIINEIMFLTSYG